MTCTQFGRQIDQLLAGDLRAPSAVALRRHTDGCGTCRAEWNRVQTVRGLLAAARGEGPDPAVVRRARDRLRAAFGRAGQAPIRFGSLDTPVGRLYVGTTDRGVCDVAFGQSSEREYRHRLLTRSPEIHRDDGGLAEVIAQLTAYFSGDLIRLSLAVDLRGVTPFTTRVLREVRKIRFGDVTSYGELATRLGSPGASRAVGGALGRNPVPIVIPCHRVVARGGRIGGFTGGLATKRILLGLEGHRLSGWTGSFLD